MSHLLHAIAAADSPNGHVAVDNLDPNEACTDSQVADDLTQARTDLASARTEIERLNRQREIRDDEATAFRDSVARVAMRYAREHDWCSVVTDALAELGLTPPEVQVSGAFTVRYEFSGTVGHSYPRELSESWIASSIDTGTTTDNGDPAVRFDSDWDDVTITAGTVTVEDYTIDGD